jgi:hypothetical protein
VRKVFIADCFKSKTKTVLLSGYCFLYARIVIEANRLSNNEIEQALQWRLAAEISFSCFLRQRTVLLNYSIVDQDSLNLELPYNLAAIEYQFTLRILDLSLLLAR